MKKTRVEETSKRLSAGLSQAKSKTQITAKGETTERKKKIVDQKELSNSGRIKTVKSTSSVAAKQNSIAEPERQSSLSLKPRTRVSETSSSSVAVSRKSISKPSTKTSLEGSTPVSKSRTEKKPDTEKRGSSTIYMPKSSVSRKSTRSSRTDEVSKNQTVPMTNTKLSRSTTSRDKDTSDKSKNHYSTRQRIPSRERRKSRTLSPSEVKMLHLGSQVASSNSKTVMPPKATSSKRATHNYDKNTVEDKAEEEYYEDDFEDYESDFEECTDSEVSEVSEVTDKSEEIIVEEPIELQTEQQKRTINSVEVKKKSDEDRMLDSGHYELAEARRRAAKIETILMPRDSKSSENKIIAQPSISPLREERSSENKSLPSSTDEGFEDSRSGDFAKSPPLSQIAFIDFRKTQKDSVQTKLSIPKVVSRGEKLLEMIKLDTVQWSILESKPVAYEEFIRTHGKLNTRQMCVQTNDDNLDVETQTDGIECTSKWTQFPAKCRTIMKTEDDLKLFKVECLGVGTENDLNTTNQISRPIYDVLQLNEFVAQASKVILSLLEERGTGNSSTSDNVHELPFTESIVKLSIDTVTFLAGRPVTIIHYSNVSNKVLLTIHAPVDEDIETSRDEDFVTDCSIGCVWNILQPSRPTKIFYSPSTITSCCFHSTSYNVILAGLEDGSISLWDLAEEESWHRKIVDEANEFEWIIRSPTYSSIGNSETSGHDSEIVALRVLSKTEDNFENSNNDKFMPIQISSLDANGKLIIWSVLRNMSRASVDDLGLSWWGDLRLVKSQEISLCSKKKFERNNYLKGFTDMHVDRIDTNSLYIATNSTNILHAVRIGKHANPLLYKSNDMDWCGETKCIENCPFDQPFFLVGCDDGTVRLHSTTAERPLLHLKHEGCNASIKALQWSRSKPLTIYVLDIESKIHVWDLGSSDMFPIHSVSTKNWARIESMELSPCRTGQEMLNQYIALGSDNGCVEVHRLNKDFHHSQKDATKREMNTFLRYVHIL